ncbi:MAG: acetate/propionate family kinase [Pseudomonadota bacterium]
MSAILTLNAGSSSLKFARFEAGAGGLRARVRGEIERIGGAARLVVHEAGGRTEAAIDAPGHDAALQRVLEVFAGDEVAAVGHRVVHGGDRRGPARLTDAVMDELAALTPFVPLHQPHNLAAVEAARAAFPTASHVASFDTSFHRAQPFANEAYGLPRAAYDRGIKRYGFHGLSHTSITRQLQRDAPEIAAGRVVIAHLGSGASLCAVDGGRSVACTMGFSALDGPLMGTRCGSLDPGVVLYLLAQEGMTVDEVSKMLHHRSGLLGLSGLSNDMRVLEAADTAAARAAIDAFVASVRREVGAMAALLGGLDALVFTGGIGENSARVRAAVCASLGFLGIDLDAAANASGSGRISGRGPVAVFALKTDEETVIAEGALALMA